MLPRPQFQTLAIKGGKPVRADLLPYGHQTIDEDDIRAVEKVLRSPAITRGPAVEAFEAAVAEKVGMSVGVAFNSATAALHAVMELIGVDQGKKVITSPITFAATSNAVLYCEGNVLFKDVSSDTMNLDPKALQKFSDLEGVRGITVVDYAGNPCDYEAFQNLKKKWGVRLISDASHSLGSTYKGKPTAQWTDLSIFSFHPVKSITTGEGGMVVTNDRAEAEFLKRFRSHGIVRTSKPGYYRQESLGFNYNVTDIQCALGLSQLKKLDSFVSRRREIVESYNSFFKSLPAVEVPSLTKGGESAWHLYPLRLRLEKLNTSQEGRDQILEALIAENIGANVHYIPVYWHPYYERLGFTHGLCPVAEREYLREISLPLFPSMSEADVRDVCHAVEKVVSAYSS